MKLRLNIFLVAMFLYSLNACHNSKEANESDVNLNFEIVQKGVLKGAGEEGFNQEVIKVESYQELNEVLNSINTVNKEIDSDFISDHVFFEDYMLLFVFDKVRGTGGYKLKIDDINATKKEIALKIYTKSPGDNAPSVMTQPFEVIQLKKSEKLINATFIEQ